jgi:type II secretory pathway pseudopilin PulG
MPPVATDPRAPAVAGEVLRSEHGFTLIELLVYLLLSIVVMGAVVAFLIVTFQQQNAISSRTVATSQSEAGLEQLVRDVREAITSVTVSNPTTTTVQLQFYIPTPSTGEATHDATGQLVTWACPNTNEPSTYYAGTCTRAITPSGGTMRSRTEIVGVQSLALTSYPYPANQTLGATYNVTPSSSPTLAALGVTLTVQTTNYALTLANGSNSIVNGASGHPIVVQATADLRNF